MNNTIKNETTEVAVLPSKHNKTNESQEMGSSNNTSNIECNDNDDDDDDEQGHVTAHNITTAATTTNRNRLGGRALPSVSPSTSSSKSSWASNDDVRRAAKIRQKRQQQQQHYQKINKGMTTKRENCIDGTNRSAPPRLPIRRNKTPTTNNLSTGGFFSEYDHDFDIKEEEEDLTTLLPPTVMEEDDDSKNKKVSSSFKKWLADGMLGGLNTIAGVTLSTTNTLLSPPIALTRNIILPGVLAIIIDTLDTITPPRVQDWFRIISSSVYHFFTVVVSGSSLHGMQFRSQVGVVVQSFLEAWSAPESRQVVVDTMATGVKLAGALHTPEMELFLEQVGVLGCRFVDALASGKSKEFIHNSKTLLWNGIELASDPSTTLALAEVTAHLCHALEEVDDSFGSVTPRSVRNIQNKTTYLGNSSLMTTDYPYESMEKIILSSLGMTDDNINNDDITTMHMDEDLDEHDDDDETVTKSVPSNVAFQSEGATLGSLNLEHHHDHDGSKKGGNSNSLDGGCKGKVDLDLLQAKILYQGRPRARLLRVLARDSDDVITTTTNQQQQQQQPDLPVSGFPSANASISSNNNNVNINNDLFEEDLLKAEDMEEMQTPGDRLDFNFYDTTANNNNPNLKELYDKFETMESEELEEPSYIQFYSVIDDLLEKKRKEKRQTQQDWVEKACDGDGDHADSSSGGRYRRRRTNDHRKGIHAKVRMVRKGSTTIKEKSCSKAVKERYTNLRRLWKYPPSLLRVIAIIAASVCFIWIGFGMYGMYTFFGGFLPNSNNNSMLNNPVQQQHQPQPQPPPNFGLDHGSSIPSRTNANPNEIIIRIVKEVVHIREDGSRIDSNADSEFNINNDNSNNGDPFITGFSQEEMDKVKECVASAY
ncbi:hypothetical protein FRACYDRAFT_252149 [Fragilariopsis cylindrus CCMP1102]|uniref:Uncharacterized protein n=1 Tax=Fragilariopsis cylindrus CCMP1102 TaxID=635003 RepID=A0A1E7EMI4_9STRA|nr:hypothetical protein FRACYDRAFT_252149 [Fragilariopsis cylindrus CCMP1102]|eukprot:OEU07047.1 hypothetical protein FRACYDRAFT_252149 [Fragilariopsis cylindrus CCMP1102]